MTLGIACNQSEAPPPTSEGTAKAEQAITDTQEQSSPPEQNVPTALPETRQPATEVTEPPAEPIQQVQPAPEEQPQPASLTQEPVETPTQEPAPQATPAPPTPTGTPEPPGPTGPRPQDLFAPTPEPKISAGGAMMMEGSPTSPEAPPPPRQRPRTGQDDTAKPGPQPMVSTQEDPVSTFSLDTDRASYTRALQRAQQGLEIDPAEVRAEEWINSLAYAYNTSFRKDEFAIHTQWQLKLRDSFQMRVPGTWGRKDDYSLVPSPAGGAP